MPDRVPFHWDKFSRLPPVLQERLLAGAIQLPGFEPPSSDGEGNGSASGSTDNDQGIVNQLVRD